MFRPIRVFRLSLHRLHAQVFTPLAQVYRWNKSLTCSHYSGVYRRASM